MTLADDALALVIRTTGSQGVPEKVCDPAVLTSVAGLLRAARNEEGPPKRAPQLCALPVATTRHKKSRHAYGT
jgi:hypothetical protein